MKKLFLYLKLLSAITLFVFATTACSQNDDEPNGSSTSATVTINADGTTSNGAVFIPVSDDSFYLDYVLYKIVEAHLEVVGVDKSELKENVTIYSSVTYLDATYKTRKIDDRVFIDCSSLVSVSLPEGVTYIGDYTFSGCSSLVNVKIPKSVTTIGSAAFFNCSSLKSINLPEGVKYIGANTFSYCKSLVNVSIPEGVTSIGSAAFGSCSSLITISIPEGIRFIGSEAFIYCSSLKAVRLPNNLTEINDYCFYNCESLEDIEFPKELKIIENNAFDGCINLKNIIIPSSCEYLYSHAFANCYLKSVILPESLKFKGYGTPSTNYVFDDSKVENVEAYLSHWSKQEIKSFFEGADITNLKIY